MTKVSKMTEKTNVRAIMAKASKKGSLAGLKHSDVAEILGSMKTQIAQSLPKHLTAERIIQMSTNIITRNPKIAECSASSIVGSVMEASVLGFRPSNALGQCYFVPYGGHVQFQIGYRGWIDLARRSGKIKTLYAYVVREGDHFEYTLGLEPKLEHKPNSSPEANITHVYACAHYVDGGYNFIVLNREEIESLRMRNSFQKAAPSGAWKTDYEEMAKAKAIKKLAKYMPLSDEMQQATAADDGVIDITKAATNDGTGIDPDGIQYDVEETDFTEVNDDENE